MCGRYTQTLPGPVLAQRFEATAPAELATTYNAAPSQRLAVITNARPDEIQLLQWGLVPAWVKDRSAGPQPINARAETLAEKPSFRTLLRQRRCLVLADSFYEWQQQPLPGLPVKTPHRILLTQAEPFAFAGLWDEWVDRATGEVLPTFTIVTTEPNALMARLHHRMPVILPDRAAELAWLAEGPADAHQALLRPLPDGYLTEYVVSKAVNSPAHNGPELLDPVE
ncbi:SOS response-associated peptidase [Hymenobacter rigui]|uniref:Abasic site processing protein n=1 Tax=Hymenobacter rigui TaxID=334424 RepID=A0A428KS72_9BACT|nr:SOS response-associated peptidase [Hymenobacter rigui]RSK49378.1 SOS response-associated peptidase [Hymenobacter rigui]